MARQKHKITDKKSGVTATFETDGPPDWGNNMPNPDMITLGEETEGESEAKTEAESEKDSDVTFDLWYQLRKSPYAQGNTVLYIDSVVSYCLDVKNHYLLAVRKDKDAPNGLTAVFMNTDTLIGFGANYAPDKAEDTFSLIQKPNGAFFGAGEPA